MINLQAGCLFFTPQVGRLTTHTKDSPAAQTPDNAEGDGPIIVDYDTVKVKVGGMATGHIKGNTRYG